MPPVTRDKPCPICGKPDWCFVTEDGEMVICNRVESERQAKMGWIHFLSDPVPIADCERVKPPKLSVEACDCLVRECYKRPDAKDARERLAESLGVSVESLEAIGVGTGSDWNGTQWTSWPARDADGQFVGLTRRYWDGSKKTYPGTRAGLFYARKWVDMPGAVLIVEGGSDVAACLSAGIAAIGRPSNVGGSSMIAELLSKHPKRAVLVVAERDFKPERRGTVEHCPADCPGCANCWPGLYGAKATAKSLGIPLNWIMPRGGKDAREAITNGEDVSWVKSLWSAT